MAVSVRTLSERLMSKMRAVKAEALRSQAEFFRQIDMPIAADHCEEAALAWESPGPIRAHVVSDAEECWCEPTVMKVEGKADEVDGLAHQPAEGPTLGPSPCGATGQRTCGTDYGRTA